MFNFFVRKILLSIGSVFLICSLVFLLSRVVPGSYQDISQENELSNIGNKSRQLTSATYLSKRKASGYDKPLFYFGLRTWAQPDTLHLIFPAQHQSLLQNYIQKYGNWPAIAAYYSAVLNLQQKSIHHPSAVNKWPGHISYTLLSITDKSEIENQLKHIKEKADDYPELAIAVRQVENKFKILVKETSPWQNYVPALRWYGSTNQYHQWAKAFIKGNLGNSLRDGRAVTKILLEAIGNSILFLTTSLLMSFTLAIELSLALSRMGQNSRKLVLGILYILDSIPLFIVALLILTILAGSGYLSLFPVFGLGLHEERNRLLTLLNQLHHLILPIICLTVASLPYITTQLYQEIKQVSTQEFVSTARAKGLAPAIILRKHIFRNALMPLITLFTGYLPALITGTVILEVIFAIPGTGRLLAESVLARDYPVVLGLILWVAVLKVGSNILADILYRLADPRIRIQA